MTSVRPARAADRSVSAGEQNSNILEFRNVTLTFRARNVAALRDVTALRDVSFSVQEGQFLSVIGPSGCGKSTILNLATGLIKPTSGTVLLEGDAVTGLNTNAAYVTQDANLLPWLTVASNIGLALKLRGVQKGERGRRVQEWIERVGLAGFGNHYPRELSGGMQKRCAIARALVAEPPIVLMDEPFGPLDAITRLKLQQELLTLFEGTNGTVVFVTHDLSEAITLSDEVIVLSRGPGQIRGTIEVGIPRPRRIADFATSPEYQEKYNELIEFFRSEL